MADRKAEADTLIRQLDDLLANSLGAWPSLLQRIQKKLYGKLYFGGAASSALRTTFAYALVTLGLARLASGRDVDQHLFWLSAWGAVYLGWAVFSSRRTTERALALIVEDIVPMLSTDTIRSISSQLAARFSASRIEWFGSLIAVAALAAATAALRYDLGATSDLAPNVQLGFWALGWLVIFFTAARCTDVARFYAIFAEKIAKEAPRLYALEPSSSVLVKGVAALGRTS